MSQQPLSIPVDRAFPPSMDYALLRRAGIEAAQRLSGDIWTDYNVHDPGITLLETLAYAITELGYKANLPIEDLLFGPDAEPVEPRDHAMFPAPEVLPAAPLTIEDYRALIIDRIPAVRNAWLEPVITGAQGVLVGGLYRVLLQLDPARMQQEAEIIEQVRRLLTAHRSLCEDLEEVRALKAVPLVLSADITLDPDAVGESVVAQIWFELSEALTPRIRLQTLEELLASGTHWEQAFNGPAPVHGFVSRDDLRRSELAHIHTLHKSRLVEIIARVEGVAMLNNVRLTLQGKELAGERMTVEDGLPVLDVDAMLESLAPGKEPLIRLSIGNMTYQPDAETLRHAYDLLVTRHQQRYERPLDLPADPPAAKRRIADIVRYDTIQNHLPRVFGVGEAGLPSRSTAARQAQALQLQGYLMVFEQLMGNYLAQLGKLRLLLSVDPEVSRTYYYQNLSHLPGAEALFDGSRETVTEALDLLTARFDRVAERRNRFLDHLLARFGEAFQTDAYHALGSAGSSTALLQAKASFLNQYLFVSRNRGLGLNYLAEGIQGLSGLQLRVALTCNLPPQPPALLSSLTSSSDIGFEGKGAAAPAPAEAFRFSSPDRDLLPDVLMRGAQRTNYSIEGGKGDKGALIRFKTREGRQIEVFSGASVKGCEEALDALIAKLLKISENSEGFYLVEHTLLRPVEPAGYQAVLSHEGRFWLRTRFAGPDPDAVRQQAAGLFRSRGSSAASYRTERLPGGGLQVFLTDASGQDQAVSEVFYVEESAKAFIKEIAALAASQKNQPDWSAEARVKPGAMLPDDPYSFQVSVVLPNWPLRFQEHRMQSLIESLFRRHAPAHLRLSCYWLDLASMKEFEDIYQTWLQEKRNLEPDQPLLDDLSYYIMILLRRFANPEDPAVQEVLPGLRKQFGFIPMPGYE
ncbi:MAG: hypothetical protein NW241_22185 [Bacteroidia bacterium]|nr:hypothetical protein [Bacteroidia bacterium]